ncbi:MAG: hypothetical protein ACK8QZ_11220, partial [Anaerolineales bacterium]
IPWYEPGGTLTDRFHLFPTSYDMEICIGNPIPSKIDLAHWLGEPGIYWETSRPGTIGGVEGVFEIGVEYPLNPFSDRNPLVVHRQFRPN